MVTMLIQSNSNTKCTLSSPTKCFFFVSWYNLCHFTAIKRQMILKPCSVSVIPKRSIIGSESIAHEAEGLLGY